MQNRARLVAVVDPRPPERGSAAASAGVPWFADLEALLAAELVVDVAVLCTPLPTHAPLTTTLLRAGIDVLLEKPPTTTLAEFTGLCTTETETGRLCQVGFQSLGSAALAAVEALVADGAIGEVRHIGAAGTWVRPTSYWRRARWAGRRALDGRPVVDGVCTNPLAHAVATALRLAGARRDEDLTNIEVELFRANDIEADDTSSLVLTSRTGLRIAAALTLCAPVSTDPWVALYGTSGLVRLHYTRDEVSLELAGRAPVVSRYDRTDLLANLLAARQRGEALLNPLADNGAFMAVLEAVRVAPDPTPIDPALISWQPAVGAGAVDVHPVVSGVTEAVHRVASTGTGFRAVKAPWA
ncbi:MAG: Gfo/Idh/MocA family oxidoreductase [Microlunatus sp.]|nr:Gfo/Idh/MocA family oxidoreductase [Microlunatus sp.]